MDVNGDGYVTRADFNQMAGSMGLGYQGQVAANQAFNRIDRDQNGIVTPNEQYNAAYQNQYQNQYQQYPRY